MKEQISQLSDNNYLSLIEINNLPNQSFAEVIVIHPNGFLYYSPLREGEHHFDGYKRYLEFLLRQNISIDDSITRLLQIDYRKHNGAKVLSTRKISAYLKNNGFCCIQGWLESKSMNYYYLVSESICPSEGQKSMLLKFYNIRNIDAYQKIEHRENQALYSRTYERELYPPKHR